MINNNTGKTCFGSAGVPASSAAWARHREFGGHRIAPISAATTGEVRLRTAAQLDRMGDNPSGKWMAGNQTWRPPD